MVHVRGQNLKETRKEENVGLRGAWRTGQQLCFLVSPEGQSVLREKKILKKQILTTESFRGQPGPSSGVKWTFIGKYEALMFSAQVRSQDVKMREWKAEIV
jgi:hypothetical protein